jgi:dihydrofolate reductase
MRKLIVCNLVSLDGYYNGPGGSVMALPMDDALNEPYFLERMRAADTLLLGRISYENFIGFWPPLADDPAASQVQREIGALYRTINKVVVSGTLAPGDIVAWRDSTSVIRPAEVTGWLAERKRVPGHDILMFGSRTTWTALLAVGLVDELHLLVGPGAVTDGTPLFAKPLTGLHLLEARHSKDADAVMLRYATRRPDHE